ncbi:MAG TPA: CopD family protein [Anaerolineaceae bacterium]
MRSLSPHRWLLAAVASLMALLLWVALPAGLALAHANLVNATPGAGEVVATFPAVFRLEFSEAVDPDTARMVLYAASGAEAARGTVAIDPNNNHILLVTIPAQPNGVYGLSWQVTSAVDGHETQGTLPFSVGLSTPRASLIPPQGTPDPTQEIPAAVEVALRWVGYLALAMALGSAAFAALVWHPAYHAAGGGWPDVDARVLRLLRGLIRAGAAGVALSLAGLLAWTLLQPVTGPFAASFTDRLDLAIGHTNEMFWFRVAGFPLLLTLLTLEMTPPGAGSPRVWWQITGSAAALLVTYSLTGHPAASGAALPIIADWLHLTAVCIWMGGLLPLGMALYWIAADKGAAGDTDRRGVLTAVAVRRFSRVALICVAVIGLSGLYNGFFQVRTLAALTGTRYGQAILVKAALFGLLIGLGAINQLGWMPRMARWGQRAFLGLGRTVRVELGLGLLVLAAASLLVSAAPAFQALQAEYRQGLHQTYREQGVRLDFRAAPAAVGENDFAVDVVDTRPAGTGASKPTVLLRFKLEDGSTGTVQAEATSDGSSINGRYTVRGSYLSRMGVWLVQVIWRRSGMDDVTHVFTMDLPRRAADLGEQINPVPATADSVARGKALFQADCAPCHGSSGRGDGPSGQALIPPPADLVQHAQPGVHTDGQLFAWISSGYPGSAMPAFQDTLTAQQRWDVINFLRALGQAAAGN